jgi:serine/threonine-protein kinase
MRPQVGQLVNNKYRLVRMLGDGGMGSVFEARHEVLGSSVALKFLHPELARRQGLVQRFLQEARVSAKIQSLHVVRVTDVEQTGEGLPFIVMEFLNGKSLQALYEELYRNQKRLTFEDGLRYAMQILDGLEAAHEEGVVHRDLKPDNVMIVSGKRGESVVKLLDFGIAKLKINGELYKGLTRPGVIMGTPEYMAPEQVFSADQVDARADIFSCGVMFFEMFAGRRPVGGEEAHQIAAQYLVRLGCCENG